MTQLLTIIGARPQIIKSAAISRAIDAWNQHASEQQQICETILHTGQHYDDNMSEVFIRELGLKTPDINLHVGSASHAEQTAKMLIGIEEVLTRTHFDGVIIYGDTNSTLAGALAAAKLGVPVFHIEAGLRSFNRQMPEEINRIVADSISSILFTPTTNASKLLSFSGVEVKLPYRQRYYVQSGDIMYDNALYYSQIAEKQSTILSQLQLTESPYVLATVHRPANTDHLGSLTDIMQALLTIAKSTDVVLPLHPRTRAKMPDELLKSINKNHRFHLIEPVPFLDMIHLEKHAQLVLTDSGGVQKEAFFFGKPCVILRFETEWSEIVDAGAAITTGSYAPNILAAYKKLRNKSIASPADLYGDGHAANIIVEEIADYLSHHH